jgi:hypothetical protein
MGHAAYGASVGSGASDAGELAEYAAVAQSFAAHCVRRFGRLLETSRLLEAFLVKSLSLEQCDAAQSSRGDVDRPRCTSIEGESTSLRKGTKKHLQWQPSALWHSHPSPKRSTWVGWAHFPRYTGRVVLEVDYIERVGRVEYRDEASRAGLRKHEINKRTLPD